MNFISDTMDKKIEDIKHTNNDNLLDELKKKNRELEDRSRRNNLRIEGVNENLNESWNDTENKVLELFSNKLRVDNVEIERAHRTGQRRVGKPRTIVLKLLRYKDKERILQTAGRLKGTNIYINEDFSKETLEIRKKVIR